MSYFYAHIIDPADLHKELEVLEMTDHERNHLVMLVQTTMHHKVIDMLLEVLHDDHKHVFLRHIADDNHEGVWELLNEHVGDAEGRIRAIVEKLKIELLGDIQEARER